MKKMLKSIIAAATAALLLSVPMVAAGSDNLLTNPGAENGLSGWTDPYGTWKADTPITPYEGDFCFFAGVSEDSAIYQDVSISGNSGSGITLGGWLAGYYGQKDQSILILQFLDANGNDLGAYAAERDSNDWAYYEVTQTIPQGAATARVILESVRYEGSDNDGYFDALSLTIGPAPIATPVSKTRSAFTTIEGEDYDYAEGVQVAGEGGGNAGYIENGDYTVYENVDFGSGARSFRANCSAAYDQGGTIELRLDSPSGTKIGSCDIDCTGSWNDFEDFACNVTSASGVHDLYLVYKGVDGQYLLDVNYFVFDKSDAEDNTPKQTTTERTTEPTTQRATEKQTSAPSGNSKNTIPQTKPFTDTSSPWAQQEMKEAYENGLIPDVLIDKDLRQNVSRAEFASIAVTLYEELSGNKLSGGAALPFNDISGVENIADIQKAYAAGIAVGTSSTTFAPYTSINREQLVTMLCRSIKKYKFPEWTIATDSEYMMSAGAAYKKFADDADISDFARDSVYFMANMGIVKGVDDTHFAPKAVTDEQTASGYAVATREQAIAISLRIFKRSDMM